ncbi:acyltransferase [Ramlibacter sp. H39-3-26]|uniref:acyltransferase family protein n=1 Tax=Curvibacter soli TaxID=3031331 RepID=UPI0023D991AE|nr:acyltransferase [Ramlibacter sp. H39-3-26]MDF1484468.1 acyltransferase [Ramlibacter sp. H39-3-26]
MKNELRWLQALRGIAALMVLFFHMRPHWELVPSLSVFAPAMQWGFSGVDIFFTLSGFVVYRSAQRTIPDRGIVPFAKKRLLRIYLGYWPVLVLIALTTVYVYDESLPELRKIIFSALLLYPNIWDNWLPPAWSLTMEIYFYLWVALIVLAARRHPLKALWSVIAVLVAWNVGWLIMDPPLVYNGQQPLRYGLTGLGIEFLAGALVARSYDRKHWIFSGTKWTPLVCVTLMIAGVCLGMTSPYFDRVEIMRAASFGLMGLGALVLALTMEQTPWAPPAWLVAVGDASYSLYLLHTFLLDASSKARVCWGISEPPTLRIFLLGLPVAIVLISMLWYRWVEKPIMRAAI